MEKANKSLELHNNGYNCAQCVLAANHDLCGLDENTALSITTGFGGGMRCGEICGAISGGVMAISHAFTSADPSDMAARNKATVLCKEFIEKNREKYGAIVCRELKGPGAKVPCNTLISENADLVAEIINNNK